MTKKNRVIILMLALVASFVMIFSSVFVIIEANHVCDSEQCHTCCQLEACENTLKTLADVTVLVSVIAILTYIFIIGRHVFTAGNHIVSLVTLKVKLSN